MGFSKKVRESVYAKYGGRCAYCGEKIVNWPRNTYENNSPAINFFAIKVEKKDNFANNKNRCYDNKYCDSYLCINLGYICNIICQKNHFRLFERGL